MLIDEIINYCDKEYSSTGCECANCKSTYICQKNCKNCLDDIHYHKNNIRTDYNCKRLLNYYICRYSYKYCSEIMYALKEIDFNSYSNFNILSLGCGGAADLMAFDEICSDKINNYYGLDINEYWKSIHEQIISSSSYDIKFLRNIDVLTYVHTTNIKNFNVIIIEYLISYLYPLVGEHKIYRFFDDIIKNVVSNKSRDTPMLIIINDVDSCYTGRDTFQGFIDKLNERGYNSKYKKKRFKQFDYYNNSEQYETNENFYNIDYDFQQKYCVAKYCESVQLIIEVE